MKVQQSIALVIAILLTCVACSRTSEVNHSPSASSGVGETDSTQNVSEEQASPNIKASSDTDVSAPFESLDMDINAVTSEEIVSQPQPTDVTEIEHQPQSSTFPSNSPSDDVDTDVMTGVSLDPKPAASPIQSDVDANAFTGGELAPLPDMIETGDTDAFTIAPDSLPEPGDLAPESAPDLLEPIPAPTLPERGPLEPIPAPTLAPERGPLEPTPKVNEAVSVDDDALPARTGTNPSSDVVVDVDVNAVVGE